MKTLIGHLWGQGVPGIGNRRGRFFQGLGKPDLHFSKPWKIATPFKPLRQPVGGHGNFRKEHRAG
jgi:hypothetical protein